MFKRVVIKISGEAIGFETSYNDKVVTSIVKQIIQVVAVGTQVALTIGGGNYWRGRQAAPEMDRVKADQMGMLATIMNALYLKDAFSRQKQQSRILTPFLVGNMTTLYHKDTAMDWLDKGIVLINAGGLGHPMFSTDTITALRAAELEADCVLYAKNTDGVYDSNPRDNPDAKKYRSLSYSTAISNNLCVADMTALQLSEESGIPSYVFGLDAEDSILKACSYPETGNLNGTYIHVSAKEDFYGHQKL